MRELFSSEPNLIKFITAVQGRPHTPEEKPTATLLTGNTRGNLSVSQPLTVNGVDNGEWEIPIPQTELAGKRFAAVKTDYTLIDYGVISDTRIYEVCRRLVNFEELNDSLGEEFAIDYNTFTFVESDVRKIIESYCNQEFNSWTGTLVIEGYDGHIIMPERIEKILSVRVGTTLSSTYQSEVKGYLVGEEGMSIYNPERDKTISFFHGKANPVNYTVEGVWGYGSVPAGVHQAALELARGFLCDDIEYRRRYIDNIRNGDMRIQFAEGAYGDTTGNPIADQMLRPYRAVLMGAV